jgi:hypothetical protein
MFQGKREHVYTHLPDFSPSTILADGEQNGILGGQNEGFSAFTQKFFIRATLHFIFPVVSTRKQAVHYNNNNYLDYTVINLTKR